MITDMSTDTITHMTTCITVYREAEFKIAEQQSQIVWHLGMESTITPRVLKWLAGTIRDYHCQLSQSEPDWTTESDRCKEREQSATTLSNFIKPTPPSEYGSGHMMAYEEGL
jgi:hypothetical protein